MAGAPPTRPPLPAAGAAGPSPPPDPAGLARYAAVRLFVERAAAARPAFALTAGNGAAVAALCARLDGLPLALELAAARVRVLPPPQLLARLEDRFRLLTGGGRDAPPRQQTLRATVGWSHDLLAEPERRLFARLAVFAGGWTLEAAEAVGAGDDLPAADVLDGLTRLVDQSLVVADEAPDGTVRFGMLETLREYARDRLDASGGAAAVRRRHAAFYLALAEASRPPFAEHHDRAWLERLEREHDNLRAALTWTPPGDGAADGQADPETGPRLAAALWRFWWQRGHFAEGLGWLERALRAPAGPAARARALGGAGVLAFVQGDLARSRVLLEESLALARASGDRPHVGWTLHRLGVTLQHLGDSARAAALGEESVAVWRGLGEPGEPRGLVAALIAAGITAQLRGDAPRAAALCGEVVALLRDGGDRKSLAHALQVVGCAAGDLGDAAGATARLDEALALFRALGDRWGVGIVLRDQMLLAQRRGDPAAVAALGREVLPAPAGAGHPDGRRRLLRAPGLGGAGGPPTRAGGPPARRGGGARAATGALLAPVRRGDHDAVAAAVRAALGAAAFAAAWAEGHALSPEAAVAEALEASAGATPPAAAPAAAAPPGGGAPARAAPGSRRGSGRWRRWSPRASATGRWRRAWWSPCARRRTTSSACWTSSASAPAPGSPCGRGRTSPCPPTTPPARPCAARVK